MVSRESNMETIKNYYRLAKPGIVYGNLLTTIAAFLFASQWHFNLSIVLVFLATVVGLGLVIASAAVFNNYLDREIDKKMERTAKRALVTGLISERNALMYARILGVIGFALLCVYVNLLTAGIALIGFIFYVGIYGYAKRKTHWGAVVGSIPGAVPIVVGYTAVTGHLDLTAFILFLILVAWQMPHFYGIAMYRLDEYKAAGIPVFPAKKGIRTTKIHIVGYMIAYLVAVSALTFFGFAGYSYLVSVLIFGFIWLVLALKGFSQKTNIEIVEDSKTKKILDPNAKWARKVFLFSLIVIVTFSLTLAVAPLLP
jgi:protoheme IX farnesyltransferase